MKKTHYFGKNKTGGANASYGFDYQDRCAILLLLEHCQDPAFKSVGIETDDDFCLIFEKRKIACQVKIETLTVAIVKSQIADDKFLIGSTVSNELRNFYRYLKHFRNQKCSDESSVSKVAVVKEFADVLKKYGFNQSSIDTIPDSWSIKLIPENGLEQRVAYELISQGMAHQLSIDIGNCLNELYRMVAIARKERGFISSHEVLHLLKKHGSPFIYVKGCSSQLDFLNRMSIDQHQLLQSVDGKLRLAHQALKDEKYGEALNIYQTISSVFESKELLVKCAALFQLQRRYDEAQQHCDRALQLSPHCGDALAIKGTLQADLGDLDFALELLCAANVHKPGDPFILYNIGVAHLQLRNLEKAADFFQQTIELDPSLGDAHLNLSICLFKLNFFYQSLEHVDRALILNPGQPQALSHKGELKRFYGDYDAALKLFQRCLKSTPDNPIAKRGEAICMIEKGERLGYALFVRAYKEELNDLKLGSSMVLVDIGWERTLAIKISNVDGSSYKLECDGLELYVPKMDNGYIGIGVIERENTSLVPIIMKNYNNSKDFNAAVNAIKENVLDDSPISVTGFIQNYNGHSEINIELPQYTIYGKTNSGRQDGFNKFCEVYDGVVWLILECGQSAAQWQVPITGLALKH